MQIICKDGTTIPCDDFEAIDSGVLFYQEIPSHQQTREEGDEGEEEEQEEEAEYEDRASGFVPSAELHFVLPDQMVQQPPQQAAQQHQQRSQLQQPGQSQQVGGMGQQQQMQQHPNGPQR